MKTIILKSAGLPEYLEAVYSAGFELFRGQSNADWGLTPSLYRCDVTLISGPSKEAEYHFAENAMLRSFYSRAIAFLPGYARSDIKDRIIAQHYGVPTRLLDWTLDPLVALFFAVQKHQEVSDAGIFSISVASGVNDIDGLRLPYKGSGLYFNPPALDQRISAQKSVFTIHDYGPSEEDYTSIDARSEKGVTSTVFPDGRNEENLSKIVIPSKFKYGLLSKLLDYGIDQSALFPGMAGIGTSIAMASTMRKFHLGA